MIKIEVSRRDAGRLLGGVRNRLNDLRHGLERYRNNWDEEKGANMLASEAAYADLEKTLTEAIDGHDNTRRAGRDQSQHQGRRDAPGDYRPA